HRPSTHCLFSSDVSVTCAGVHPLLPSFPTRRSSDLGRGPAAGHQVLFLSPLVLVVSAGVLLTAGAALAAVDESLQIRQLLSRVEDRKSTRLNSSHVSISYAVFCLKKKKQNTTT